MTAIDQEDIDLQAAEYVLGTLEGPDRRDFEQSLKQGNIGLQKSVVWWEEYFSSLLQTFPEVVPDKKVFASVLQEIRPTASKRSRSWNAVLVWKTLAMAASLLLVMLTAYVTFDRAPQPALVSVMQDAKHTPLWLIEVEVDGKEQRLRVRPLQAQTLEAGKSLELWMLPKDGAPVSLGLLPDKTTLARKLTDQQWKILGTSSALAVSLEPQGGSTTGAPTGPVLYSAPLTRAL